MIRLDYKSGKSIYEQIYDGIKNLIISGVLKKDDKLPSVRELSISLTVNPNTVQKAYKELENDGFIYSVKAKGNFVSEVKKGNEQAVLQLLDSLEKTVKELKFMGVGQERVGKIVAEIYKQEDIV